MFRVGRGRENTLGHDLQAVQESVESWQGRKKWWAESAGDGKVLELHDAHVKHCLSLLHYYLLWWSEVQSLVKCCIRVVGGVTCLRYWWICPEKPLSLRPAIGASLLQIVPDNPPRIIAGAMDGACDWGDFGRLRTMEKRRAWCNRNCWKLMRKRCSCTCSNWMCIHRIASECSR